MSRRSNSKYRVSRRLGVNLWGRDKDPSTKRNYPPGVHGPSTLGRKKLTDYGLQLRAKQRIKFHYDVTEKHLRSAYIRASNSKGDTAQNIIGVLESTLMSFVYRSGFAPTIFAARQRVSHGHFLINGKKANIASHRIYPGDVISVRPKSRDMGIFVEQINDKDYVAPSYLEIDKKNFSSTFVRVPSIDDVPMPFTPELNAVVEYYS